MKAISLWQPWASLMQTGAKTWETRSWKTNYRGPLVICSTKTGLSKKELNRFLMKHTFQSGLMPLLGPEMVETFNRLMDWADDFPIGQTFSGDVNFHPVKPYHLPLGKALCVVDVVDCFQTVEIPRRWYEDEEEFGDFGPDRYAWKTENLRTFEEPFPVTGSQGFYEVDDEMVKAAKPKPVTERPVVNS